MSGHIQPGPTLMPGEPRYEQLGDALASGDLKKLEAIVHPFARMLPMVADNQRGSLRASLAERQLHAVIFANGMLLDGRNRTRELTALRKPVSTAVFIGDNLQALALVKAENIERRHLSPTQLSDYAARVAMLPVGANQYTAKPAQICAPSLSLDEAAAEPSAPQPMISQADAAEMFNVSRRSVQSATVVVNQGTTELQQAVQEDKIAISVAEKIARLPKERQPAALEKVLPNGNRAIMSSRQEPDDSLDFFPTPPWATRALIERVLIPKFDTLAVKGLPAGHQFDDYTFWEPACGEGHMAEVLREYSADLLATDVFDYGYGDATLDFTNGLEASAHVDRDFIITNPPFGDKSEAFVLQALQRARRGVAMFVRLQWLETIGRYERIFKDNPPTLIAFFAERVNLCKGRWDPEGGTATAYIWLVWIKGEAPRAPFWIAPGCREAYTRQDDAVRFTQRPVPKSAAPATAEAAE